METQPPPAILGLILFKRNPAKSGRVRNFPYFPTVSYLRLSALKEAKFSAKRQMSLLITKWHFMSNKPICSISMNNKPRRLISSQA
jgi:hypothetical protein